MSTSASLSAPVQKRVIGKHACENCRKSKIRCITDTLEQHGKCRKCLENGNDCEWKAISQTRNRKRTNDRVTSLENQLSAMTATLEKIDPSLVSKLIPTSTALSSDEQTQEASVEDIPSQIPLHQDTNIFEKNFEMPMYRFEEERRAALLRSFATKQHPLYPLTNQNTKPLSELERSRPYTLNSMITAACMLDEPASFKNMHETSVRILIKCILISGQKNHDLIQALLILAAWTDCPDDIAHLNVFQLTHMAYTMATEMGLLGKTSKRNQKQDLTRLARLVSEGDMENLWIVLAVCLSCSRIDISFRRQSIYNFDLLIEEHLMVLAQHAATADDHRLLAWINLQKIANDIEALKQSVEIQDNRPGFSETNFSSLEDDLCNWEQKFETAMNVALRIELGFYRSKLHELAIYLDHDSQQLEVSALETRSGSHLPTQDVPLNPTYLRTLLAFIADCHHILDAVIDTDHETLRILSLLTIFRIPYAFKALGMLEQRANNPKDGMSKIIDHESIKWKPYARAVSRLLGEASAGGKFVVPGVALRIRNRAVDENRLRREVEDDIQPTNEGPESGSLIDQMPDLPSDYMTYDWMDFDPLSNLWEFDSLDQEASGA